MVKDAYTCFECFAIVLARQAGEVPADIRLHWYSKNHIGTLSVPVPEHVLEKYKRLLVVSLEKKLAQLYEDFSKATTIEQAEAIADSIEHYGNILEEGGIEWQP